MIGYLVDTDVISAGAPTKAVTRPGLIEWMNAHSADLFLSAVTIAEIAEGIAKARRKGAERKAADLSDWLQTLLHLYADRVRSESFKRLSGGTQEQIAVLVRLAMGTLLAERGAILTLAAPISGKLLGLALTAARSGDESDALAASAGIASAF